MKYFYAGATILLVVIAFYLSSFAKSHYTAGQSHFRVSGKCTMKNWTFESTEAKGEADFEIKENSIQNINSLKLSLPGKSLHSDNKSMNSHAYDALKADQNPNIIFTLIKTEKISPINNAVSITGSGNLTVAGVTKPVILTAKGTIATNTIILEGAFNTKMTNFNITPPTFALGGIKAHDEVEIQFRVAFSQ